MNRQILLLPVMLAWLGGCVTARAEDCLVADAPGCLAIGGEWQPGDYQRGNCLVHHLVVDADDSLTVAPSVNLTTDGGCYNYGRMQTRGYFQPNGTFNNRGMLITEGLTVPGYLITNVGTFVNRGWIHTHGQIDNYGVLENEGRGLIETCSGAIINYAYMHNAAGGNIDNWGTLIRNQGFLVNDGDVYNPSGDFYRIENSGAFENTGSVYNGGTFWNACGGAFYGRGNIWGNAVEYQNCDTEYAIQLLIPRVLEAGSPSSGILSKSDVNNLTGHLGRATKDVRWWMNSSEVHNRDSAEAELQAFVGEVQTLTATGKLPGYLGAAFVGWADQILYLLQITQP